MEITCPTCKTKELKFVTGSGKPTGILLIKDENGIDIRVEGRGLVKDTENRDCYMICKNCDSDLYSLLITKYAHIWK